MRGREGEPHASKSVASAAGWALAERCEKLERKLSWLFQRLTSEGVRGWAPPDMNESARFAV